MKTLKRTLCLVLVAVMALSLFAVAASAKTLSSYTDASAVSSTYKTAVDFSTQIGVLKGMSDTEYGANGTLTRAQLAAMIYRIATGDVNDLYVKNYASGTSFKDVKSDAWYAGYVNYCADNGYLAGVGGGKYDPSSELTGYQAMAALLRVLGYGKKGEFVGKDWTKGVTEYASAINAGIVANWAAPISRQVAAQLVFNTMFAAKVTYNALFEDYTKVVKTAAAGSTPAVYATIKESVFDIQEDAKGAVGSDNYNRPSRVWNDTTVDANNSTVVVSIPYTPVYTFTTGITECDLANALGKTSVDLKYFVDGKEFNGTRPISALNTTGVVGFQGTLSEIYVLADGTYRIVQSNTYLAEVTGVTTVTYDTANHQINNATMTIKIGSTTGIELSSTTNYGYKVGDMILVKTYGGDDYKYNNAWAIDVVGAAKTADVAIAATHSTNNNKDGVIAGGVTYLANSYGYKTGVSSKYVDIADTMINKNYRLYLDQYNNILGMVALDATAYNLGVIIDAENVRVGTNKYVADVDMFMVDGSIKTLKFVTTSDTYFATEVEDGNLAKGNFIKFATSTVEGNVYYKVSEVATQKNAADNTVMCGITNTLDSADLVNDKTQFIVEYYRYDYTASQPVFAEYRVFNGFKTIPNISGSDVDYYKLTVNGVDYILVRGGTHQVDKAAGAVDASALFISKAETYQYYSVYNVVINGAKDKVSVSNNITPALKKISKYEGLNVDNYYTSVTTVGEIAASSGVSYADGVLKFGSTTYLTVANNCAVYVVNPVTEAVYPVTLAHIAQYSAKAMNYELDANGYVSYIYIID